MKGLSMFGHVARFEFHYQLRNPVFWVAVALFFLLAFGATTIEQIQIGNGGNVLKNAPYSVAQTELILSIFFLFVSTAFVANIVVRDDEETGFGPILRTTRLSKADYLFGRFAGAFGVSLIAFAAIPLGIIVGSWMPWVDAETLGPNRIAPLVQNFLMVAVPNVFISASIFFALATATRSMMTTYIAVVVFLIAYTISTTIVGHMPRYEVAASYFEPFGIGAFYHVTKYWTAADRNQLAAPIDPLLLTNRALWIAIGVAMLAIAYRVFKFQEGSAKPGKAKPGQGDMSTPPPVNSLLLPKPRFDGSTAWAQLLTRTHFEILQIVRSPAYLVLLALGLLDASGSLFDLSEQYGTPVVPVTRVIVKTLGETFSIVPIIVAIYYAGELVWRERDRRFQEIVGASAMPDWAFVLPKVAAMAIVLLSTLLISVVGGILVQLMHGYTSLRLDEYLLWYVIPGAVDWTLIAILAMFVQALSPHKFVGWAVMLVYIVSRGTMVNLGLDDVLYNYGRIPAVPLSDMNGMGHFWVGAWWVRLYWSAVAVILIMLTHLLWRRGSETRLMPMLRRLPRRLVGSAGVVTALALTAAIASGAFVYVNTHVWNQYRSNIDEDRLLADTEKTLLRYEHVPQPSVKAVRLLVDIRPYERSLVTHGRYLLVNRTGKPLERMHIRMMDFDTRLVSLSVPGAHVERDWPRLRYTIWRFERPLLAGATTSINFTTVRAQHGFRNSDNDTAVVANGTFVNDRMIAPSIGMTRAGLLDDRTKRRRYGLPAELRMPKLEDRAAQQENYIHADWIRSDVTVQTAADQTPLAAGDRVSDVTTGGRRTARFVSVAPVLDFLAIQSARYAERHLAFNGLDLVVYYDRQHGANVDRMLAALRAAMPYYVANFGRYPFHQARIVEFPAYAAFAQAFPGTMPYSEGIGFIADLSDPDKIDYVTYVVAHELSHQWWAHQLVGADMQGSTMLSETLAQYSALMVMERLYGPDQIRRFLKFELDKYLAARGTERIEELPLDRVENQPYIHYRKGAVAMYLLKDRIGADRINAALRQILAQHRFRGPPWPRSLDLVDALRSQVHSAADQDLITDLFERITLYDLKTIQATVRKRRDGRFDVTVQVDAHKFYADGKGVEHEVPFTEPIDIGLFTAMPGEGHFDAQDMISIQRMLVTRGPQALHFVAARRPTFAGIDPYNKFVDRNSDDNVVPVVIH